MLVASLVYLLIGSVLLNIYWIIREMESDNTSLIPCIKGLLFGLLLWPVAMLYFERKPSRLPEED